MELSERGLALVWVLVSCAPLFRIIHYALIGEVEDIFMIKLCKALDDLPYMALIRPGEMREGRTMRRSRFGCRNCKLRKLKVCTCLSSRLTSVYSADYNCSATKPSLSVRDVVILGYYATSSPTSPTSNPLLVTCASH